MSKDASTTVEEIVGKIKMKDGTTRSFRIGTDFGWRQWGECERNLGNSVSVIEAMVEGLQGAEVPFVSDNDDDDEGPEEGDEDEYFQPETPEQRRQATEDYQKTYKIIRYTQGDSKEVRRTGLTLAEAQAHCSDPSTKGEGWFDGWTAE